MDGTASQEKPVCGGSHWVVLLLLRAVLLATATLAGLFISTHSASASDELDARTAAAAVTADQHEDKAETSPVQDSDPAATHTRTTSRDDASDSVEKGGVATPGDSRENNSDRSESSSAATESTASTENSSDSTATETGRLPLAEVAATPTAAAAKTVDRVSREEDTEATRAATEVTATVDRTVALTTTEVTKVTTTTATTLNATVDAVSQPVTDVAGTALKVVEPALAEADATIASVSKTVGLPTNSAIDQGPQASGGGVREEVVAPSTPAAAVLAPAHANLPASPGGFGVASTGSPVWLAADVTTMKATVEAVQEGEVRHTPRSPLRPFTGGVTPAGSVGSTSGGSSFTAAMFSGESVQYFPSVTTEIDFNRSVGKAEAARPGQRPD